MLTPRAIALQGVGYAPRLVALQGFALVEGVEVFWDTTQGMAGAANRAQYNRLLRDDELVTDLIVTLVTQGFFDGHSQNLFGGR